MPVDARLSVYNVAVCIEVAYLFALPLKRAHKAVGTVSGLGTLLAANAVPTI